MPEAGRDWGLRVAVIGAGVIGTSVAYACAEASHNVVLIDLPSKDWSEVQRELRRHRLRARLSANAGSPPGPDAITLSTQLSDVSGAGIVIENIVEDREVKRQLHAQLADIGTADAVIAINTSAIPIAQLLGEVEDPGKVAGVHFMNPVSAIDWVEVIRAPATSESTLAAVSGFLATLGKQAVVVRDAPGFVINRILMVMVNQAAALVQEDVATPYAIDQLFKGCLGHSMGPLRTADLIGLDTIVRTLEVLHDAYPEPIFDPVERLLELVSRGELGMKTGRGFYTYAAGAGDA